MRSPCRRAAAAIALLAALFGACSGPGADPASRPEPSATPEAGAIGADAGADGARFDADASRDADADAASDAAVPECVADADCAIAPHRCGTLGAAAGKCLLAPSCDGRAGTHACGATGDADCCAALPLPAGSFLRNGDSALPARVSAFRLDTYEITVGRMRAFFEAFGGDLRSAPPVAAGAGAHPLIARSGWRPSFNVRLPGSWAEIDGRLGAAGCVKGGDNDDGGTATWTHAPGAYEDKPITCIDWYTLFAFCAWDGGRIPTDAELAYAEAGGDEQRTYAWGNDQPFFGTHYDFVVTGLVDQADGITKQTWGPLFRTTDPTGTRYVGGPEVIAPPGRKPKGNGRWGHADLTGNVLEWTLDAAPVIDGACADCANVAWPDPPQNQAGYYPLDWLVLADGGSDVDGTNDGYRSIRGGSWDPTHVLATTYYYPYLVARTYGSIGGRCAR